MTRGGKSSQEPTLAAVPSTPPAEPPASSIAHLTVGHAMQRGLIVCPPDADLKTIARTMAEASIHCVFVTDILRRNHNRSGGVDGDQTPTFCLGRAAGVEIGVNGPG